MPVTDERQGRYYRSPSRTAAPSPVISGPGIFGLGLSRIGNTRPYTPVVPGSNTPGSLRDMSLLEQFKGGGPSFGGPPQDPLEAVLQQIAEMIANETGTPVGDYAAQARAETAAQFDPQIAAINAAMAQGKSRTAFNKQGIEQLYDTLAQSYPADIRESKRSFKEARKGERKIHEEGSAEIQAGYDQAQQDLAQVMQELGIQEAAPAVLPGIAKDEAERLASEAERSTSEQRAYARQGQAENAYYSQGPSLARMGSAEGQSFLTQQLNEFLLGQQAEKAQLESQKALTYNSLLGQYRQGGVEQQQNQLDNLFRMLDSVLAVKRFEREGLQSGNATEPSYQGVSGAATVLGEMAGAARAPQLQGELMNFLAEEVGGAPSAPSYPEALNMLRDYAENKGYSSMDLNALTQALAAYFNLYR